MATIGNTGADGGTASATDALHVAGPFQMTENGTATLIGRYDGSGLSPHVGKFAIYADDGTGPPSAPGALLAVSAEFNYPASAGWVYAAISLAMTSGTKYWFGFASDATTGNSFWWDSTLPGHTLVMNMGTTYPNFPDPPTTVANDYTGLLTIEVTYTPSDGSKPFIMRLGAQRIG